MTVDGRELYALVEELYPLHRSITGEGLRTSLERLGRAIPLRTSEVPSGTPVLDWTVPPEWEVREAWIEDPNGRRVVDVGEHNLHLMAYSVPVRRRMTLEELRPHLHSLPEHPDRIPYRTSYFEEDWGFCLRHETLASLEGGAYEVCVDTELSDGSLTYGECLLPGASEEEVLVSAHSCHPSLANDNLAGMVVAAGLARETARREDRRYSYRFLFAPGTIGALAWLARNEDGAVGRVRHGLVLAGLGDGAPLTYKRSRRDDAVVDRAAEHVLRHSRGSHRVRDFTPTGGDERQFCSPGFDLPVGSLTRSPPGAYPEFHTSADDLDFVTPDALEGALRACLAVFEVLEGDAVYRNTSPKGEPQLGRRGLYRTTGGTRSPAEEEALLWVLNLCDGSRSLLDVAERSGLPFPAVREAADALAAADLLVPAQTDAAG